MDFSKKQKKGVCLICHGLNTDPKRMNALGDFLESEGIETFRMKLTGHCEDPQKFKEVSSSLWLKELYDTYLKAKARSQELGVPLYYLGYSLGGALNAALMQSQEDVKYDKIFLFAPALAIRKTSYLIRLFKPLGKKFIIPSFAPKDYTAHKGISGAAYDALFDVIALPRKEKYSKLNVPTQIFIDPMDELVSPGGLLKIKKEYNMDQWEMVYVTKSKATAQYRMKHLILDKESLGEETWAHVQGKMKEFLSPERKRT